MDRLGDAVPAAPVTIDADASDGWDAYTVWQDRVHGARRKATVAEHPRSPAADGVEGWDPVQTWQLRVRRARNERKR